MYLVFFGRLVELLQAGCGNNKLAAFILSRVLFFGLGTVIVVLGLAIFAIPGIVVAFLSAEVLGYTGLDMALWLLGGGAFSICMIALPLAMRRRPTPTLVAAN